MIRRLMYSPRPLPFRLGGEHVSRLAKLLEDELPARRTDADAVVGHSTRRKSPCRERAHGHRSGGGLENLAALDKEVEHHLHQAIAVGEDTGHLLGQVDRQIDSPLNEQLAHRADQSSSTSRMSISLECQSAAPDSIWRDRVPWV